MPQNILLIVFDTARADAFEAYGAPAGASPVIADLARRGVSIPNAFSTSNWTLPAHASMFSGSLPWELGLVGDVPPAHVMNRNRDRLLPEFLASRGYRTAGVSANTFVSRRHGFHFGFERFEEIVGSRRGGLHSGIRGALRRSYEAWRARVDDGMEQAEVIIRRWITDATGQPFFWFVNLMECHSPYLPPRPYNDLPFLERIRAGGDVGRFLSYASVARYCMSEMEIPAAALGRMRHLYAQAVRALDTWVGRIAEELDRRRMLDDTLLVITSDHGENLGEEHLIGHVMSLDDRLLRVPLVMAGPGARAPRSKPTSLASVPRLIAEAAELETHPWGGSDNGGVVFAQTEGFRAVTRRAAEGLVHRWHLSEAAAERMCVRQSCAVDGRFKLVRDGGRERLHDLVADPTESTDVLDREPGEAARLRAALDAAERTSVRTASRLETEPSDIAGSPDAESEELERRLKLLGYL